MSTEKSPVQGIWQKCFSTRHQAHYWFNCNTGQSLWSPPETLDQPALKRVRVDTANEETKGALGESCEVIDTTAKEQIADIAIIVPFRDLHVEQKRSEHLARFVPEISMFLSQSGKSFHIYIIEQSVDNRKFNRGKLLNIGFDISRSRGGKVFVFHDVDLLPSRHLLPHYTEIPTPGPVHIARVWGRYSSNPNYFGGIVAFSRKQFEGTVTCSSCQFALTCV